MCHSGEGIAERHLQDLRMGRIIDGQQNDRKKDSRS